MQHLTDEEFEALYGPWDSLDPAGVADLMAEFPGPWWVVGGWAIEAFSGRSRPHKDVDIVIFRRDLADFLELVGGRYHVWSVGAGMLRPITVEFPEPHEKAGQLWLRGHARAPWVLDCLLNDDRDGQWVSRRDPEHCAPLDQVTWLADDGIRYQNPEIVLRHKATFALAKDTADLAAALPLLSPDQRGWLRDAVRRSDRAHPWLTTMTDD